MSHVISHVEPFVSVKLETGKPVGQAFDEGKAGAIRALQREIKALEDLTFSTYAYHMLPQEARKRDFVWVGPEDMTE